MDYIKKITCELTNNGETFTRRHLTEQYCNGNGIDVGSEGCPVKLDYIQIEYSRDRFYKDVPIQLEWDGTQNLPFKDNVLDYVYSSHLIEDYVDLN